MPSRVARLRLAQAVETQFDTSVVAAFEAILAGASEDYRLARDARFKFGAEQDDENLLVRRRIADSAGREHLVARHSLRSGSNAQLFGICRTCTFVVEFAMNNARRFRDS